MSAGGGEGVGVEPAIDRVGGEQAAEDHDLGDQKGPHAEAAGVTLLPHVLKMVRERGVGRCGTKIVTFEIVLKLR